MGTTWTRYRVLHLSDVHLAASGVDEDGIDARSSLPDELWEASCADWSAEVGMPVLNASDQVLLYIANCTSLQLAALTSGPKLYPFPVASMVHQAVSDRMALSGEHLRDGDQLLFGLQFRSSISRHYYAMYHVARAIVFAQTMGDEHQLHRVLPRHLPRTMLDVAQRESELTSARLLRNEADYDPYPSNQTDWEYDARQLSVTAADFVQACEDFALSNGHV